jgi:hypothetical protein
MAGPTKGGGKVDPAVDGGRIFRTAACGTGQSSGLSGAAGNFSEQVPAAAFDKGGAERVTRLYTRDDLPEDQCWLRAPGWCLAYR